MIDASVRLASATMGREHTRQKSSFSYYLARLFFVSRVRPYLYMAYSYFRWLDDSLDAPDIQASTARRLIQEQKRHIEGCYAGANWTEPLNLYEEEVGVAIAWDCATGRRMERLLTKFLAALEWDTARRYNPVEQSALDNYSELLGSAYAEGILLGLGLDSLDPIYDRICRFGGVGAHLAHVLRDLHVDLELGYINVSVEDIARHDIDLRNLRTEGVRKWQIATARRACDLLADARKEVQVLPSLRARLIFSLLCSRYHSIATRSAL